ncbi:MAG: class I SAM-dependent rRNA methyltransferase [Spirochaetaceae bacterium]|jgi:23S rRNA (cytosine1962-C5)-methyltransferase|nr:class I SAM-dependent rRNA methyltransferase [Spirochaetaceae bacterium]
MKRIILKAGEEQRIFEGHPWVYDNEVDRILGPAGPAGITPGEIADVESAGKRYVGRAFANPNSKIIARLYSSSKEGADKGFFKRRIREALSRRTGYDLRRESVRLVFGEADFLPGFILDRFVGWSLAETENAVQERPLTFSAVESALGPPRSWLSAQFLIFGTDCRKTEILCALEEVLAKDLGLPEGVVERSSLKVRDLEGLPQQEGLLKGTFPDQGIVIFENGFPFCAHLGAGQKTGHFLDQKDNRRRIARWLPKDARVLDAFAYTGAFGIHAVRFGAAEVRAVEVSKNALSILRKNAELNAAENRIACEEGDVFELLRVYQRNRERFDLIVLDPPAFAKSRSFLADALRGYKEINLQAMKLLVPGGVLVTCSCSQVLNESRFKRLLTSAAADADRRLIQLDFRYQGLDHPILAGYDESLYLKCGYYRVL